MRNLKTQKRGETEFFSKSVCVHSENCALMCTGGTKGESFFVHGEQQLLVYMEWYF